MNTVWIYGLCECGSDTVRYVGKTKRELSDRLAQHISNAKSDRPRCPRVAAWLGELEAVGATPQIIVLEQSDEEHWDSRERYWIAKLASPQLLNISEGGDKGHSISHSEISKMRMREAYSRNPARRQHILKLNAAKRGSRLSGDHIKNLCAARKGLRYSEESKRKMSESALKWYANNPEAVKAKGKAISDAHKKSTKIADNIDRLRLVNVGSKRSSEVKAKLSAAHKNSPKAQAQIAALNASRRIAPTQPNSPTLF